MTTTLSSLPAQVSWAPGPRPAALRHLSPSCSPFFSCLESCTAHGWPQASAPWSPSASTPAPHSLGSWPVSLFLDPKNQVTAATLSRKTQ